MIHDNSTDSYHAPTTQESNLTQERELFRLYDANPDGLTDRRVAEVMGWSPAHASARRNGLKKRTKEADWKVVEIARGKDPHTRRTVAYWGLRKGDMTMSQGTLL